jgi:hypothetical protein
MPRSVETRRNLESVTVDRRDGSSQSGCRNQTDPLPAISIAPIAIIAAESSSAWRDFPDKHRAWRVRAPMTLPSPGKCLLRYELCMTRFGCGHQPLCSQRFAYSLDSADCPWLCPTQ